MNWRIIGCGTALRGDDEAGLLVARQLRGWGLNAEGHDRASLDLIESWQPGEAIILIDAMYSGAPPGTIVTLDRCQQARLRPPGAAPRIRSALLRLWNWLGCSAGCRRD